MSQRDEPDPHDLDPTGADADTPQHRTRLLQAVIGLIGIGLVAILGVVIINSVRSGVAEPAGSPSSSPTPAISPSSASASSSPGEALPSPSSEAPPPTVAGPVMEWEPVASFASDGYAEEVRDMVFAAGRFIAVGYREPDDARGRVGPPVDEPRIWTSANGGEWQQAALGAEFEDAHLTGVVDLPDGTATIYGWVESSDGITTPFTPAAWTSEDGLTWTRIELEQPSSAPILIVAAGPEALITVQSVDPARSEIWHSVDGRTWTVVHQIDAGDGYVSVRDWDAGPEGFVVVGYRGPSGGGVVGARPFALASSDGTTWFEAAPEATPVDFPVLVAPVGGDWMAVAEVTSEEPEDSADIWYSANGLDWARRGTVAVTVPEHEVEPNGAGTIGTLVPTGDRVIASGSVIVCCHGPWWAAGVWSSSDGALWQPVGFPDGTVVFAAAEHEGTVVLGGFDRARPEDGFKTAAVFWIGRGE